jgi:hypothetical protein
MGTGFAPWRKGMSCLPLIVTTKRAEARIATVSIASIQEPEVALCWDRAWIGIGVTLCVELTIQLCVFPGIPSLFQQLLLGLTPYLPLPPASSKPFRHLIFTK